MNCCRYLSLYILVLSFPCGLNAQQTDFLEFISGHTDSDSNQTSIVKLVFEIQPGMHIQSNDPQSDNVIPTRIELVLAGESIMGTPEFPQPKTVYLEGSDQPLKVFSGRFEVVIPIRHVQPPQQLNLIAGTIYYQACNDKRCFNPRELGFKVSSQN